MRLIGAVCMPASIRRIGACDGKSVRWPWQYAVPVCTITTSAEATESKREIIGFNLDVSNPGNRAGLGGPQFWTCSLIIERVTVAFVNTALQRLKPIFAVGSQVRDMRALSVAGVLVFAWCAVGETAAGASPNDTARYWGGLAPAGPSSFESLTRTPQWKEQARYLNGRWAAFDQSQLSKVRIFIRSQPFRERVAYYMFSGPDFAYITSFFPNADIYVLSGLEPVSDLPNPFSLTSKERGRYLADSKISEEFF
jgi:hypothetical protein